MTIAWGEVDIHPVRYDDGSSEVVAGSQFELLSPEGVLAGVIGKALSDDYDADDYAEMLYHEGFGVVLSYAKDNVISLSAIDPTEPPSLVPYTEYILDSYRGFLWRRARADNPTEN